MQSQLRLLSPVVLCALALHAPGACADQPEMVKPGAVIEVPASKGKFDFLRVDSRRHRLLGNHEKDGTWDAFDLDRNVLITRLKLGTAVDTAADPDSKRYYVSLTDEQRVAVVDAGTLKEIKSIPLAGPSDAILFEPKNQKVYVTHDEGAEVWVIDPAVDKVVGSIAIPGVPEFMVYDPDADRIYLNIKTKDEVVVIDPATNTVTAHWSTAPAKSPHGMALDSAHHRIFSAGGNGKLAAIDTRTGKLTSAVDITTGVDQIAFDAASGLVYCAGPDKMSVVTAGGDGVQHVGEFDTAATAKNVAVDPATRAVWTTYTDGHSSFAKSWTPAR